MKRPHYVIDVNFVTFAFKFVVTVVFLKKIYQFLYYCIVCIVCMYD